MCDMGEDETVEHVVLECVEYARDRNEVMQGMVRELGNVRVEEGNGWCCCWDCVKTRMTG